MGPPLSPSCLRVSGGIGYENRPHACVAQLDRALASEAKGRRFDSCRARPLRARPRVLGGGRSVVAGWLVGVAVMAACRPPAPVLVDPRPTANPMPSADAIAQTQAAKDGRQGAVRVAYCIDTDGVAQDVRVIEPFESEFDALAVTTVEGWRFEPATRDGLAYETCTNVRIELRPPS